MQTNQCTSAHPGLDSGRRSGSVLSSCTLLLSSSANISSILLHLSAVVPQMHLSALFSSVSQFPHYSFILQKSHFSCTFGSVSLESLLIRFTCSLKSLQVDLGIRMSCNSFLFLSLLFFCSFRFSSPRPICLYFSKSRLICMFIDSCTVPRYKNNDRPSLGDSTYSHHPETRFIICL